MDFTLSERETYFRDRVKAFIDTRIRPRDGDYRAQQQAGDRWKVLPVIEEVKAEAKAAGDAGFKALIEGVDLTERAMLSAMERHGVKKLAPEGEKFDPNFHQAMFEIPNPDVPTGTVLQVVQPGYSIGERVLRPAMVGVSKGGPKQAAEAPVEPGPVNEQAEKDA